MRPSLRRLKRLFLWLQTGWSILGVTLVLIVLLELGFEGRFWLKDRSKPRIPPDPALISAVPEGSAWLDRHYRELEALSDGWQPYVYFRQRPFRGQTITINAEGLRATWEPPGTANAGERRGRHRKSSCSAGRRSGASGPAMIARFRR